MNGTDEITTPRGFINGNYSTNSLEKSKDEGEQLATYATIGNGQQRISEVRQNLNFDDEALPSQSNTTEQQRLTEFATKVNQEVEESDMIPKESD